MTQDGHLVFKSGINHNITFQAVSGGFINVGSEDLSVIVQTVSKHRNSNVEYTCPSLLTHCMYTLPQLHTYYLSY
jgi:hypothetical protein